MLKQDLPITSWWEDNQRDRSLLTLDSLPYQRRRLLASPGRGPEEITAIGFAEIEAKIVACPVASLNNWRPCRRRRVDSRRLAARLGQFPALMGTNRRARGRMEAVLRRRAQGCFDSRSYVSTVEIEDIDWPCELESKHGEARRWISNSGPMRD